MTTLDTATVAARSRPTAGAARHTAAAEELASCGRWEQAYQHLRAAVRMLDGQPGVDALDRLRREHAGARGRSRRDSLAATYDRRPLGERLVALLGDPDAVGRVGVAVALLEVDRFTQLTDSYGRSFGDRVLQRLVTVLDSDLPQGAFCARYGGAQLALVLPRHDHHAAVAVCEAARARVADHPWSALAPGLHVTVSVGVAHGSGPGTGSDGLVAAADVLLHAARNAGRNAVAYRDVRTGLVRLAGAAAGRRSIPQPPVVAPRFGAGPPSP